MKIFQNKTPRTWKSAGIQFVNGQIEMSSFSFMEEVIRSSSNKFTITIIGKTIVGNGVFSIIVYKDGFTVWQEELSFNGTSFSKKIVEIEEESEKNFKIVLSRGKTAKGKIIVNSILVNQDFPTKKESELHPEANLQQEDEPTFVTIAVPLKKENIANSNIEKKSKKKPVEKNIKKEKAPTKRKKKESTSNSSNLKEDQLTEISLEAKLSSESTAKEEKKRNDISVNIIDFSTIEDERDIFKYINQISFNKDKYIFLIKKTDDISIDLSKYNYLNIFNNDFDLEGKLIELNPKNVIYSEKNLNQDLLLIVKNFKDSF